MIYLDNNASTVLDSRVLKEMIPFLSGPPCNASSMHRHGQRARSELTRATKDFANELGISPSEVIFTSGATEALNMLIYGTWLKCSHGHVVTSLLEHSAVLKPLQMLEKRGLSVTYLAPKPGEGAISSEAIQDALRPNTCLIVLTAANNETGVITDLEKIAQIAEEQRIPFLVDGVALVGKQSFEIPHGVTAFCLSSHKFHGPLGVGIAVVRKAFRWSPVLLGGSQQGGRRGGTENIPGIVGCVHAFKLMQKELSVSQGHMQKLRDHFERALCTLLPDVLIHGNNANRLCNTSSIAFLGTEGETLLMRLDMAGVAASHGSACSSGALEPSRVLIGMAISSAIARSSLRFSLSKFTTEEEIDKAVSIIVREVCTLRGF